MDKLLCRICLLEGPGEELFIHSGHCRGVVLGELFFMRGRSSDCTVSVQGLYRAALSDDLLG